MLVKPELIKAGDTRVVADDEYQRMIKLLERAATLVGNPGTNISSSTDFACESWHKDYQEWKL